LVKLPQLSDIVEKNDCPSHFILSVLDRDGADFDMAFAVGSRIGQTQLASHRFASEQRFRNQLIQRCVTDGFNQRNADCRIAQLEQLLKSRIHKSNATARVNYEQAILHCAENCLRPGFAPRDLAFEFPLALKNVLQRKTNAVWIFSAVYQKRGWTFTADYLRNELLNLSPRRGPFLPEKQRCHCE
jgi:hypothetical protein